MIAGAGRKGPRERTEDRSDRRLGSRGMNKSITSINDKISLPGYRSLCAGAGVLSHFRVLGRRADKSINTKYTINLMEWKVEQPWKGELINDFPAGASLGMEKEVMVAPALSCRLGRGYAFRILLPDCTRG